MKVDYQAYPDIPPGCQLNTNKKTGLAQVFRQYRVLDPETGKKKVVRESVGTIKGGVFRVSKRWEATQENKKLTEEINQLKDLPPDPGRQGIVENVPRKVSSTAEKHHLDEREQCRVKYLMDPILLAGLLSSLSGGTESVQIANYFNNNRPFFERCFPDLPSEPLSHDIVYRAFLKISPEKFDAFYQEWIQPLVRHTQKRLINVDGHAAVAAKKGIHKSGGVDSYMFMNIYDANSRVCLAHMLIDKKSNEITVGSKMLAALDIAGSVVTADAMSCRINFVDTVLKGGADYCLLLEGNQDRSLDEVMQHFAPAHKSRVLTLSDQIDLAHGRIEKRICKVLPGSILSEPIKDKWSGLSLGAIVQVLSSVQNKKTGKVTEEVRHYICSLPPDDIEAIAWAIRQHRPIENNLHGALGLNYRQDGIQAKNKKYLTNRVALNKLSLRLLEDYRYRLWTARAVNDYPSLKSMMERCRNPLYAMECLASAQALL